MAYKDCKVFMTDPSGVKRSAQVTAESLFGLLPWPAYAFKSDDLTDFASNVFEIEITEPVVRHQVTVGQLRTWLNGNLQDPRERTRREKLKAMIGQ